MFYSHLCIFNLSILLISKYFRFLLFSEEQNTNHRFIIMKFAFACVSLLLAPVVITARLSVMNDGNHEQNQQHQHQSITTSPYSKINEAKTYKNLSDRTSIEFHFEPNGENVKDNKKTGKGTSASSITDDAAEYGSGDKDGYFPPNVGNLNDSYDIPGSHWEDIISTTDAETAPKEVLETSKNIRLLQNQNCPSVSCTAPSPPPSTICSGLGTFKLELKTDDYGYEISWELKETVTNNIIECAAPDTLARNTLYSYNYCLQEGVCYTYNIKDTYGDGK
jgi:hypothetical protein